MLPSPKTDDTKLYDIWVPEELSPHNLMVAIEAQGATEAAVTFDGRSTGQESILTTQMTGDAFMKVRQFASEEGISLKIMPARSPDGKAHAL